MKETKRCPYCGEEILAVAKKCKHCGEWLDKKEEVNTVVVSSSNIPPTKTTHTLPFHIQTHKLIAYAAVFAFVLIACLVGSIRSKRNSQKASIEQKDPAINFADAEENSNNTIAQNYDTKTVTPQQEQPGGVQTPDDEMEMEDMDSETLLALGERYEKGTEGEINLEAAFYYYSQAAKSGDATALNKVGNMYAQGKGCTKNTNKAAQYYEAAAKKGNKYAQHNIAFCYWDGVGVKKNHDLAIMWMRRSAEQGYEKAQRALQAMDEPIINYDDL